MDIENLIPGSPAWEREIERSIRAAAGVIVLLSPDSNDSEWVRREISFAEQNEKRIFPVLIRVMKDLYSGDKWQLTDNDYCDYQPRWGM